MITTGIINGTECYISGVFKDVNGNPYTPTSLSYRIDDLTNGVNVLAETDYTPAATVLIPITDVQNVMNAASLSAELRQVVLHVGVPGGTSRNDPIEYTLIRKVGTP